MKLLKYIMIASSLVLQLEAHAQADELKSFLERFQAYASKHYPKVKWTMPVAKPESGSSRMPQARVSGFMQDPETGLRHYPDLGRLYDPKTGYYIAYDPEAKYQVNTKTGKIYKGESEVEVEHQSQ